MAVGKRETGARVIKDCRIPTRRGVTVCAITSGENRPRGRMRRIVGRLPGAQMASRISAVRGCDGQVIIISDVAGKARNVGMSLREQKSCSAVVKLRVQPTVEGMARIAGGGKYRSVGCVRRVVGLLIIGQMTRHTLRRQSLKLANRGALVAILALHCGVRTEQRETILVLLDLVDGNLPAINRVALRAIGAELPQVNVRMAVRAIFSHVGEHRLRVAFQTANFLVLSTQRISGFVVIEFQHRAYGTPGRRGVTVFARNRQRPVRTADIGFLSGKCRDEQKQPRNEQCPRDQMCVPRRILPSPPGRVRRG